VQVGTRTDIFSLDQVAWLPLSSAIKSFQELYSHSLYSTNISAPLCGISHSAKLSDMGWVTELPFPIWTTRLVTIISLLALRPTQHPIKWIQELPSGGINGRSLKPTITSIHCQVVVRNFTSMPPIRLYWTVL